jgi:PAS domain S-box-containing protein
MKPGGLSLSARITVATLAIVLISAAMLMRSENARIRELYISEQTAHLGLELETEALLLHHTIEKLSQDVLFLATLPDISDIANVSVHSTSAEGFHDRQHKLAERVQHVFSSFSGAHSDYFKIRLTGLTDGGRKTVRIDNLGLRIQDTLAHRPLSGSDREFYKATLGVREGTVKLSRLNIPPDEDLLEHDYGQTLRASTPIFTRSGELFGMLMIYMDIGHALNLTLSDLPGVKTYLADDTGNYLLTPDSQIPFRRVAYGTRNIVRDFPFTKEMFSTTGPDYRPPELDVVGTKQPLYTLKRISYDPDEPAHFMVLMHYLPEDLVEQQMATIPSSTLAYGFAIALLIGTMVTLMLRRAFHPLRQITLAADRISEGNHDIELPRAKGGETGSLTRALNTMLFKLSQREQLLQESETRYRRLHESMMDAFVMFDMSGRLKDFNRAFVELTGYSADELRNLGDRDITPSAWHDMDDRIVRDQIIPFGYSSVYEKEYARKDGRVLPVELKCFLLNDADGNPEAFWAIVRDISGRKQAEEQLRDLTAHLQTVREEEKLSMAREIHDDLGGTLSALKIKSFWLKNELACCNGVSSALASVDEMAGLIDNASGAVRKLITGLRPTILDDLGLLAALEWQAEQFQKHTGIACSVNSISPAAEVGGSKAIALFRIFQETLTNVAKHSGASWVEVEFCYNDDEVMLSVSDNGRGMASDHLPSSTSYGIRGMHERVLQLGGHIEFSETCGGGLTVTVTLRQARSQKEAS